jgi:serine/threonine protein phosphatase PrpC
MKRTKTVVPLSSPPDPPNLPVSPFDYSTVCRKGHDENGDYISCYSDGNRFIGILCDGVSGEPGAGQAASVAAKAAMECLEGKKKVADAEVKEAISMANKAVLHGFTTIALVYMEADGSFIIACVGDSIKIGRAHV